MQRKILLDTDIGDDIDDAVCLAYLLAHRDCDLLGVTTVTETAGCHRAALASMLCRAAGRDVPILPGTTGPLLIDRRDSYAPQQPALRRWPHQTDFPCGEALPFMRRTIRENPGQVTLVAIGPLTNLALLFAADPELPGMLAGLYMMCGVFEKRGLVADDAEWNARSDPHATAMVYRAARDAPVCRSIGLDVTHDVALGRDACYERFAGERHAALHDLFDLYFTWSDRIIFHDALAAACVFDPSLCGFARGRVAVETYSRSMAGLTRWTADAAGPHEVATRVDSERFFDHYFAVFQ